MNPKGMHTYPAQGLC